MDDGLKQANLDMIKMRAQSMEREEIAVILSVTPLDMLYEELGERITTLSDFKNKFDNLVEEVK